MNISMSVSFLSSDGESIREFLTESILNTAEEKRTFIISVICICFASFLFRSLSFPEKLKKCFSVFSVCLTAGSVFTSVFSSVSSFCDAVSDILSLFSSLVPLFLYSLSSSGLESSALLSSGLIFGSSYVFSSVASSLCRPFCGICLSFAVTSGVSESRIIKGIYSGLKKTSTILIPSSVTLLCAVMGLKSSVASSADTVTKKAVKTAVGLIPVFGSSVSEGLDSLFSSGLTLRTTLGNSGLTAVFMSFIPPLLFIAADWILLSFSALLCRECEVDGLSVFLSCASDMCAVLFTVCALTGILFSFSLALCIGMGR